VNRPAIAQRLPIFTRFASLTQDVIIDIGDILRVAHHPSLMLQIANQDVVNRVGEGMAQMRGVVRRDAADVNRHIRLMRGEDFDGLGKGVVEVHGIETEMIENE